MTDRTSDCYSNPSEIVQKPTGLNYVQTNRAFEIPVIDCRQDEQILKYKDVDHSRTRALREVVEQRNQEKFVCFS